MIPRISLRSGVDTLLAARWSIPSKHCANIERTWCDQSLGANIPILTHYHWNMASATQEDGATVYYVQADVMPARLWTRHSRMIDPGS